MWLELSEEDKEDYSKAKKAIKSKLIPTVFSTLDKFNQRSMLPGETLPLFLHDLKRLLDQGMPDLPQEAATITSVSQQTPDRYKQTTSCYRGNTTDGDNGGTSTAFNGNREQS